MKNELGVLAVTTINGMPLRISDGAAIGKRITQKIKAIEKGKALLTIEMSPESRTARTTVNHVVTSHL